MEKTGKSLYASEATHPSREFVPYLIGSISDNLGAACDCDGDSSEEEDQGDAISARVSDGGRRRRV